MESAAYGCATITSKNGGLPETFKNPIFLNKTTSDEIYRKIKKLILDKTFRLKTQKNNFNNIKHNLKDKVNYLDNHKEFLLNKNIFINLKSKLKFFIFLSLMKEMILDYLIYLLLVKFLKVF